MPETAPTAFNDNDRGDRLRPGACHPRRWILVRLAERLKETAAALPEGDVIVDYGCGSRPYQSLFSAKFKKYIGADLPGNEQSDAAIDAEGRLPMEDRSADCVLSSQVLEHVVDPNLYLAEAFRVLKPGGHLVLSTHGTWKFHADPNDYWRWTHQGLRHIVEEQGFSVTRFHGILGLGQVAVQLWQDATLPRLPGFMQAGYAWTLQQLIRLMDRPSTDAEKQDASVFLLTAQKPS